MDELIAQLIEYLKSIPLEDYFNEDLPSRHDDKIEFFINGIVKSDVDVSGVRGKLNTEDTTKLIIFAERIASLAVRRKSLETIACGLYAVGFCYGIEDQRDLLVRICLLYHSILKLGYSPYEVLNQMNLRDWEFKNFVEYFFDREEEDKSLEAFNFIEAGREKNFFYKHI